MERPAQRPATKNHFFQGLIFLAPEEKRSLVRLLWRTRIFKKNIPPFLKKQTESGMQTMSFLLMEPPKKQLAHLHIKSQ
jgi:hypothetical protein